MKKVTPLATAVIALALGLSACAGSPPPAPSPVVSTEAKPPAKPGRTVLLTEDLTLEQTRQRIEAMDDDVDTVQSTVKTVTPKDFYAKEGIKTPFLLPSLAPQGWVAFGFVSTNDDGVVDGPVRVTYVRENSI